MARNSLNLSPFENRTARAAVIGLGYVGLPLAIESALSGFHVTGLDISQDKVARLSRGENYIRDIDNETVKKLVKSGTFEASNDFSKLAQCDVVSICVPTPLSKGKNPDMSFIVSAVSEVKKYLKKGQVIVLESTTYPGTTEEVVLPILQESGLKVGQDFYLAFSPERIDPGNLKYGLKNTPKVIGGLTQECTEIACQYYKTFIDRVIPVSSPRAAEMVKLLENTFRAINIGLANETAIMCNRLGIDTWEVIEAAATKPFGFMPFYPGPGLGGHCIPVDPHYLVWKLKSLNYNPRFIQLADEINSSMPHLVAEKVAAILNDLRKPVKGSKILILGVAYKKDIDDFRESPSLDVILLLRASGAEVSYHDPFVPSLHFEGVRLESRPLFDRLGEYDCVVLLTDHSNVDVERVARECQVLVDTRNATKGFSSHREKIVKL